MGECKVNGCERAVHAKEMCGNHYRRMHEQQRVEEVPCAVDGCAKTRHRKGLCNAHYQRALKYGDPLGKPRSVTPEERFWSKVNASGVCWEWTAGRSNNYGMFHFEGKEVRAHRFAYETLVGPIPEGLDLDHLCRNPPCVNPDHLEPVPHVVNVLRGAVPKIWAAKTRCPKGHPYDEVNTYRSPSRPDSRKCKTCARRASLAGYYRRRSAAEKTP